MKLLLQNNSKKIGVGIALVLLVFVVGNLWFFYQPESDVTSEKDVEKILSAVSRHILIPQDQEFSILTIDDPEAVAKNQAFFLGASKGDKLILLPSKAILYNPKEDILINVGPIYFDNQNVPQTDE